MKLLARLNSFFVIFFFIEFYTHIIESTGLLSFVIAWVRISNRTRSTFWRCFFLSSSNRNEKKISAKFVEISYLIREIFNLGQLSIVLIVADGILSRTKNVIHCRRFMEISYCCWNAMTTSHFRSTYVITNCLFSINQSRKILCVYTSIYCIEISVSLCVCAMLLKYYRVTCRQHEIHKRHT